MKLIIEISDKMYKTVQDGTYCGSLYEELKNGIPVEPCGDCISRQAVLEAIEDDNRNEHYSCFATNNDAECFKQIIRELPSVSPQPNRWIPVSERLPEEDGQYLITVKYKHVNDSYEDVYAEHGEWHDGRWDMFCFGHCGEVEDIIAWMPLPQPYKSEIPTGEEGGEKE